MIDTSKVYAVYSGRPGCMCGCNGTYSYAEKYQEYAGKNRGYDVGNDEVSDRNVKRIVSILNSSFDDVEVLSNGEDDIFSLDFSEKRIYVVYALK